jgi:hypothetical protein
MVALLACGWTLSIALTLAWSRLTPLGDFLEPRGQDAAHHAVLIFAAGPGAGAAWDNIEYLATYPNLSHRITALLLPLQSGDPVRALRAAACAAILAQLVAQLCLLSRILSPVRALLVLGVWQGLLALARIDDLSQCGHGAFFFTQAAGAVGLWGCMALLSLSVAGIRAHLALRAVAAVLAVVAFHCHVASGGLALATVTVFSGLEWALSRRRRSAAALIVTLMIASSVFGTLGAREAVTPRDAVTSEDAVTPRDAVTPQQHMIQQASGNLVGWVPISVTPWWLRIVLGLGTLGTAVVGVAALWRRLSEPAARRGAVSPLALVVLTAVLIAGTVQVLFLVRYMLLPGYGPYAVKKLFFFSGPLTTALWIVWLARPLSRPAPALLVRTVAGGVLAAGLFLIFAEMGRSPASSPSRDPVPMAERLLGRRGTLAETAYFDPARPIGSVYVNLVGLGASRHIADRVGFSLVPDLVRERAISSLLLPADVDATPWASMTTAIEHREDLLRLELSGADVRGLR